MNVLSVKKSSSLLKLLGGKNCHLSFANVAYDSFKMKLCVIW